MEKKLQKMIDKKRKKHETHLYFSLYEGCRLTRRDYMDVLNDLGFPGPRATTLYKELIYISRNLTKKRDEEVRRIMIG